ncbi:MAG: sulfurase [Pseudomonadota bacterium]
MPALEPTDYVGEITWLGYVPHRETPELPTVSVDSIALGWDGIPGSIHGGVNRPSCSRVLPQHPKGTEIRNVRQLSLVSEEEMDGIAADLGLKVLDPKWLGASLVLRGIPDFTHLPPSSRLQAETGATLTVDMENLPCGFPGKTIEKSRPGHGAGFEVAARNRRGVTAWVERPGTLVIGDTLRLHIPRQRGWSPEA